MSFNLSLLATIDAYTISGSEGAIDNMMRDNSVEPKGKPVESISHVSPPSSLR